MKERTVQTRMSHLNWISSTGYAWTEEKTTRKSSDIEVMSFNF